MLELTNADWSLGGRPAVRSMNGLVAAAHPLQRMPGRRCCVGAAMPSMLLLRQRRRSTSSNPSCLASLVPAPPPTSMQVPAKSRALISFPPLLPASIHLRWTPKCPRQAACSLHARQPSWLARIAKPLRQTFIWGCVAASDKAGNGRLSDIEILRC